MTRVIIVLAETPDLIKGTSIDDVFMVIVGVAVALTTLAACSHKTPIKQLGQGIGWVFGRLVGEPLFGWYSHSVEAVVRPMVREETTAIVRSELTEVNTKLDHVHDCIERVGREAEGTATMVEAHVASDIEAFQENVDWRQGDFKEWQDSVDLALSNIQDAQSPPETT